MVLDGPAVRRWADAGLAGLVAARAEIDGLNVYPIPDADTGTNLVRTFQAGVEALLAESTDALGAVSETLATAVLRGACGNSGTIVSQLLRGLADAARGADVLDGPAFAAALARAATLARSALARPVEGTILSVADAAAAAATRSADSGEDLVGVVGAARAAAEAALVATPGQLAALQGRVDAGGRGLVVLLAALETAVSGVEVERSDLAALASLGGWRENGGAAGPAEHSADAADLAPSSPSAPSHEVMYLLQTTPGEGEQERVDELRTALDGLGDSVVVVGGNGLWQVHAHVDDVGAAVEVGFAAGRPHRVRITRFADGSAGHAQAGGGAAPGRLGVVASVQGAGLVELLTRAGARVVDPEHLAAGLAAAPVDLATDLVAVLPGSPETLATATSLAAADRRLRVVRTRSAVQVIAALAVHEPDRDPARDLLEMSTAAAACRHGLVEIAEGDGVTSAGRCRAGDVLGHVDGDVAIIGSRLAEVAGQVVDLLLGGGGELVTLVSGAPAAPELVREVAAGIRARRPDVDVTTYDGGQPSAYLLVGVE
jgi:DAK2 domain fusion protein YloV